jgi:hypothetical protein
MDRSSSYRTLDEFYPFYLSEHTNRICRRLHFIGTSAAIAFLLAALVTRNWWLLAIGFVQGYAFAWIGHFFFEHNRPATFEHPLLSFMGDWRMWWQMLTGKVPF